MRIQLIELEDMRIPTVLIDRNTCLMLACVRSITYCDASMGRSVQRAHYPTAPVRSFTGQVRYIGDGDSLCVGTTVNPATWIEVRLADLDAPELRDPGGPEAKKTSRACNPWPRCNLHRNARPKRPNPKFRPGHRNMPHCGRSIADFVLR